MACAAGLLQAQAPLSLHVTARKAKVVVGEGISLELEQKVTADLEMETIELNRDRTTVTVDGRALSGKDYIDLHRVQGLTRIGRAFHAKAGSAWKSRLNLFDYTRPLAAGTHRITVAYRWGAGTVTANPVDVEIAPAQLTAVRFRWSGNYEELASIWTAGGHWFYQVAEPFDPTVVKTSVDLGALPATAHSVPVLARLNDIPANHYERIALWTGGAKLCRQEVSIEGLAGHAVCEETGLPGGIQLADPPLQLREGGFAAVVTSVTAAALVATAGRRMMTGVAGEAVVVWDEDKPVVYSRASDGAIMRDGQMLLEARDARVSLIAEGANVFALLQRPREIDVHRWNPAHTALSSRAACDVAEAVAAGEDVTILCKGASGHLVPGPKGVFAIAHDRARGFVKVR
jgi:hypothetical protein